MFTAKPKRRSTISLTVAAALLGGVVVMTAQASSHREAPAITKLPKVDNTDFYMFNSYEPGQEGYVSLIANYIPLQDSYGGPNYFSMDPEAAYEIHIDNNGDAREDVTFRFRFKNELINSGKGIRVPVGEGADQKDIAIPLKHAGPIAAGDDANLGFRESYTLDVTYGGRRNGRNRVRVTNEAENSKQFGKPYDNVGDKTFGGPNGYEAYARQFVHNFTMPGCEKPARVFVGQRQESFVVNLGETFDLVNYVPVAKGAIAGGIAQNPTNDDLDDKNITSIALDVPAECLTGSGNGVIGGWSSASLKQVRILRRSPSFKRPEINGGAFTQVSRLGSPLVNELVIGLKDKDRFNSSEPRRDGQFLDYVTHPSLPFLLDALFRDEVNTRLGANIANLAPTNIPRNDLVTAFLTGFPNLNQLATVTPSEMLRLNTAIPATPKGQQKSLGVIADDLAGFPNGRRPGDDVVDIALRVVMGGLCHPITLQGQQTDLGLCTPEQASVGNVPFTDGAPISAANFDSAFPYLKTPVPGSPN